MERYVADGWGVGELWFSHGRLVHHELPRPDPDERPHSPRGERKSPSGTLPAAVSRVGDESVPELSRRLQAYFAGVDVGFDAVELDLDWCTGFQRDVATTLRHIPYGAVVTYGELAALAGHPNAQRAAGSFCAANRFPIVLPCHRVVAAGGIGSYGDLGVEYKRRLLQLEGVSL